MARPPCSVQSGASRRWHRCRCHTGRAFEKPEAGTKEHIERAREFGRSLRAARPTSLLRGVRQIVGAPLDPQRLRIVVLFVTGPVSHRPELAADVAQHCGPQTQFWTIGARPLLDRDLAAQLTREPYATATTLEPHPWYVLDEMMLRTRRAHGSEICVDWGELAVTEMYPLKWNELWDEGPIVIFGKYLRPGEGTIRIFCPPGGEPRSHSIRVRLPEREPKHRTVAMAWARRKITELLDSMHSHEVPEVVGEITRLGRQHGLATPYSRPTSTDAARGMPGVPRLVWDGHPAQPFPLPADNRVDWDFGPPRKPVAERAPPSDLPAKLAAALRQVDGQCQRRTS